MKGAVHQCCLLCLSHQPNVLRCHIGAASRSTVIRMCHLDGTSDSYFDLASGYVWESLPPPRRIVKGKALQVSPDVTTSVKECQSQVVTHTSSLVVGGTGTWSPRYLGHGGFPHLPGYHPCILLHHTFHHVSLGVWLSKSNVRWFSILLVSLPKVPTKASQSGRSCHP